MKIKIEKAPKTSHQVADIPMAELFILEGEEYDTPFMRVALPGVEENIHYTHAVNITTGTIERIKLESFAILFDYTIIVRKP